MLFNELGQVTLGSIDRVTWSLTKTSQPDLAAWLRIMGMALCMVPALPYLVDASADASEIAAIQEGIRHCLTGTSSNLAVPPIVK